MSTINKIKEDLRHIYLGNICELAENTRDFSHEMNRLRTRCVF